MPEPAAEAARSTWRGGEADAEEIGVEPLAEPVSFEEPPIEAEPIPAAPEPLREEALMGEPPLAAEPVAAAPEAAGAESLVDEPSVEGGSVVATGAAGSLPPGEWEVAEEAAAGESPLDALSDMVSSEPQPPPPPSWEDLVERAKELADAQAAMLIGPDGALLAATDGWPPVGAAAIAAKLLPMVAPKLVNPGALVP